MGFSIGRKLLALLVVMAVCPGCFGGGGTSFNLTPEVEAAMEQASDPAQTFPVASASGSLSGIRDALPLLFPQVADLQGGTGDTVAALADAFKDPSGLDQDLELAIFAYALELVGDVSAVPTLKEFLSKNISGEYILAPHFVTRAILVLEGKPDPSDQTYWYSADEMQQAAGIATETQGQALKGDDLGGGRKSCSRQFVLVGESGEPLYYYDYDGVKRKAIVDGRRHASDYVPPAMAQNWKDKVSTGGGVYVNDDPKFPGSPTAQFNCAGYAFRDFNGGDTWTADPHRWFRVLMGTGAIVPVPSDDQIQPGDIVFYFGKGAKGPGHVAIVQPSVKSLPLIRNGYGQSGLWEASIDAPIFVGKGPPYSQVVGDYERREVWRYKDGKAPAFVPNVDFEKNPDNCDYVPPAPPCDDCSGGQYGKIYLGAAPFGALASLNAGLYSIWADDGQYDLITPQAVDGIAVSRDGRLLAAGVMSGTGAMSGDPGMRLFDISGDSPKGLDTIYVLWEEQTGPMEFSNPTWLTDNKTLIFSRVGDLHMYNTVDKIGSRKIWGGWYSTAAPDSTQLVVEDSDGLKGLVDATISAYADYDVWDVPASFQVGRPENTGNQFKISGSTGDDIRPKFCKGGDSPEIIHLNKADRESVFFVTMSGAGGGGKKPLKGPGGKIGAAACSPDGANVVVAITETSSNHGGIWIIRRDKPDVPVWLVESDLSAIWHIDLAWTYGSP